MPCIAVTSQASDFPLDAESVARGGVDLVGRLGDSPGTTAPVPTALLFDVGSAYWGTDLRGANLTLQAGSPAGALSLGLATLVAPVGTRWTPEAAFQCTHGAWRWGGACEARNWRFDGYAGSWDCVARVGVGLRLDDDRCLVARYERASTGPAALGAALEWKLASAVALSTQCVRRPGRSTEWHLAAQWLGPRGGAVLGFDAATDSYSLGWIWRWEHLALVWGARTHPELGWSHTWSCVRSR